MVAVQRLAMEVNLVEEARVATAVILSVALGAAVVNKQLVSMRRVQRGVVVVLAVAVVVARRKGGPAALAAEAAEREACSRSDKVVPVASVVAVEPVHQP